MNFHQIIREASSLRSGAIYRAGETAPQTAPLRNEEASLFNVTFHYKHLPITMLLVKTQVLDKFNPIYYINYS
jgi:hypothetical protein